MTRNETVWTPKRVLLVLAGFALFFTTYQVYANVLGLGGIDGLTPLPEAQRAGLLELARELNPLALRWGR